MRAWILTKTVVGVLAPLALAALLGLGGCSGADLLSSGTSQDVRADSDQNESMKQLRREADIAGNGMLGGSEDDGAGAGARIGINAILWRASLDTVSFMPLASADPFGGVIITDWYSNPETPNEQFKLTIYILDKRLRADALRVSMFRQVKKGGRWADAAVAAGSARAIEDQILTRARQLRIAGVEDG
jgi:hypothetical protein